MKLYEIDEQITRLIDEETGEIADLEAFEALQIAREKKIEGIALYVKDLRAEAAALKEEADKLTERRRSAEKKAERLTAFLAEVLTGETFKTARVVCAYRKTQSVEVVPEYFADWAFKNAPDLLTFTAPKPNKTAIKAAIKAGRVVEGAEIVDGLSFSIN